MTELTSATFAPVVFLDTNAAHYCKLMLTCASAQNIDVFSEQWDSVRERLNAANLGPAAVRSYENGFWILRYLRQRINESAEVFYSPITGLELRCGSLRGEAVRRAANAGVPNRWYSRMEELEVCLQLEPSGYEQVKAELEGIEQQFDGAGIVLNEQELDREVWQIARTLLENVFVDVQDCLVYASAFLRQANEIITSNGYLKRLVACTRNPGSAQPELVNRFTIVKQTLVQWYVQMSGWSEDKVILPEPRTVAEIKQILGGR